MPSQPNVTKRPSKITVKIWEPLIKQLDVKMAKACLLRDSYLQRVLEIELDCLESEIPQPNSDASREFVSRSLDSLNRKFVSITLTSELIARLTALLNQLGIVRDAFFNRFFLLLAMPPQVLEEVLDIPSNWMDDVIADPGLTDGPLLQQVYRPLTPNFDPFFYYRQWMRDHDEDGVRVRGTDRPARDGIYRSFVSRSPLLEGALSARRLTATKKSAIPPSDGFIDLRGLNCFVDDWRIPGSQEEQASQALAASIFEELDIVKERL